MQKKSAFSVTDFYLLMAMVIWGSDYPLAKFALRELTPISFSAARTIIAALVLLPIFLKREKNWTIPWRHLPHLIGLGVLGTFLNRLLWGIGLDQTSASNSALIMATSPIFVLIVSSLFLRSDLTLRATVGILISFLGVFLVIQGDWKGWEWTSRSFQGDLLLIGSSISWALFTLLAKPLLKEHSTLKVTGYVVFIGSLMYLPFLPNDRPGGWGGVSALGWFSVFYVAIMGNVLSYLFWIKGIQNIGPLRTTLYQYLQPITAILFAIPFLGESLTSGQLWGASVVFAGIFLARSQ